MKTANGKYGTFKIITLGCPVNQYESAAMEAALIAAGFRRANSKVDIYIINSCAVTKAAARKSRKEARQAKKKNPKALLVLAGCYGQLYPEEIGALVPEADIIVGTAGRSKLPEIISRELQDRSGNRQVLIQDLHKGETFEEFGPTPRFVRQRPVVKIQEGCDEFCSYCAVILARGKPRSREPSRVLKEVSALAGSGHREIIIAGTNLGIYGRDLGNTSLPELLSRLDKLKHPIRIRISSIEPMGVTDELLEVMASSRRICHYLYLPLQSGSDRILEKMGRKYTVKEFSGIVEKARKLMPDVSIMTDLIVGFPGEREEDHIKSMETARRLGFSRLHVFPYSPRLGTPASLLAEQVRPDIKKRRAEEMNSLGEALCLDFHRGLLGKQMEVLVEKTYKDKNLTWGEGYSESYALVRFPLERSRVNRGEIVPVKAEKAFPWGVEGSSAR